jgi:hypothetical protein
MWVEIEDDDCDATLFCPECTWRGDIEDADLGDCFTIDCPECGYEIAEFE